MFETEAEVFAYLDELRQRRAEAQRVEAEILDQIKSAVRQAGALRIGGEPINRSKLIEHSGLSRRTAYKILDALPSDQPEP